MIDSGVQCTVFVLASSVQCLVAAVWSSGVVVEYVVVEFVRGALHAVSSSVKNRL